MILLPLRSNLQSTVSLPVPAVCVHTDAHTCTYIYTDMCVCVCVCVCVYTPHSREVQLGRADVQEVMLMIHQELFLPLT